MQSRATEMSIGLVEFFLQGNEALSTAKLEQAMQILAAAIVADRIISPVEAAREPLIHMIAERIEYLAMEIASEPPLNNNHPRALLALVKESAPT